MSQLKPRGLALMAKMVGPERTTGLQEVVDSGHPAGPLIEAVVDCYDEIWGRPGLTLRERSLVTVAMMLGANRREELEIHIKGALANEVPLEQLWELALQATAYLGLPSAGTMIEVLSKAAAPKAG